MASERPKAVLTRDHNGVVLQYSNLEPWQQERLYDLMLFNGSTDLHVARSDAKAYVLMWNTPINHFSLSIQTEDERLFERFLLMIQVYLVVGIPEDITPE